MKYLVVLTAAMTMASSASVFSSQPRFGQPSRPAPARVAPAPARAAPSRVSSDKDANIVRYDSDSNPDGSYNYAFETDNGIAVQEQGTPRDFGGNPPSVPVVAQGSFAFTSPEGQPISISYIADENGFQPQGDAIPQPPPVPEQIAKALVYIARNEPMQIIDNGSIQS